MSELTNEDFKPNIIKIGRGDVDVIVSATNSEISRNHS